MSDPPNNIWVGMTSGDNNTMVFMADAGMQYHYKENKTDMFVNITKDYTLAVESYNETQMDISFTSKDGTTVLTLTYCANQDDYWLSEVELNFTTQEEETIVNSSLTNPGMYLKTAINDSSNCSIEFDAALTSHNASFTDVYLRITNYTLQSFNFPDASNFSNCSICFADQAMLEPANNMWNVTDDKNISCAIINATLSVNVNYITITGKTRTVWIPAPANASLTDSVCAETNVTLKFDLDDGVSMTMVYKMMNDSMYYYSATKQNYFLDEVMLIYNSTNKFFPNHEDFNKMEMLTYTNLTLYSTPVGESYLCDAEIQAEVSDDFVLMFDYIHWQVFEIVNNTFANDSQVCWEMTTPMPYTTPPFVPVPLDPKVEKVLVHDAKDNTTLCFHADLGIQVVAKYILNDTKMTSNETVFDFDKNETTVTAMCDGKRSVVTFNKTKLQQSLVLTFTNDSTGISQLANISLYYNYISRYFPQANETKPVDVTIVDVGLFKVGSGSSYRCTEETNVVADPIKATYTYIRFVGGTALNLESFPKSSNYSSPSECFGDVLPKMKAHQGDWMVNTTDNKLCSHFQFTAMLEVTYTNIMQDSQMTTFPVDNATVAMGTCGGKSTNTTVLKLVMDDNMLNLTLAFNKNFSDPKSMDKFDYALNQINITYSTKSKYFPNHGYVDGSMVSLSNSSLMMFSTDQDHSYKCTSNTSTTVEKYNKVSFKSVQMQPFNYTKDGFLDAVDCEDDEMSPIIPIIVGSVLAGLVIVVLIAYLIGRRRNRKPEYETI